MKILQVITSLYTGGAERLIIDTVPRYIKLGIKTDVLLFDGADTPLKEQLQQQDVRIFCLAKGKSVYSLSFIHRLAPYLKQYDIIHTHNTACQYFVAIACKLYHIHVPLVTTEHSTQNRRRQNPFFAWFDRWMYAQYKRIISISNETEESLKSYLKKDIPIQTICNGVNLDRFFETKEKKDKQDKSFFVCCMVGRFYEAKDQDTIIRAIKELPDNYVLWLVGDGPRRPLCERLAKDLNVAKRVRFWGLRSDIPSLLKTSDVVVLSSHWEGFGLSAVEGMAAERPVIASDVQGLAQVVKGAGILFPPGDSHQLAIEIQRIKNNPDLYEELVTKGKERARMYDINKMVKAYIKVYESVINE